MWMEIRRGKMRNYLSDKKASEEKTEEKLSAARHLIKPSPSCHAHKVDLWRAFQVPHLVRAPVLTLPHPFHAVHSQEPCSCYQILSAFLVPLVNAQSSPGATVTNQDCAKEDNSLWLLYFSSQHPMQMKYKTLWEWRRSTELKTGPIHYSSLGKKCCCLEEPEKITEAVPPVS